MTHDRRKPITTPRGDGARPSSNTDVEEAPFTITRFREFYLTLFGLVCSHPECFCDWVVSHCHIVSVGKNPATSFSLLQAVNSHSLEPAASALSRAELSRRWVIVFDDRPPQDEALRRLVIALAHARSRDLTGDCDLAEDLLEEWGLDL